jgi:hypothetical protein
MTMQHPTHPDDERLAALAGGDPEVTSDGTLRAHVDSCDKCAGTLRELGSLRTALAELPDLVPSRPLRLLPPVAEPRAPARDGWLRRLAGPAMAAGFVLVVVGAIGSSGFSLGMGASAIFENVGDNLEAGGAGGQDSVTGQPLGPAANEASASNRPVDSVDSGSESLRSQEQAGTTTPLPEQAGPPGEGGGAGGLFAAADPRLPWLVVLGLGVGLLLAGIYLRFAQQPRAG